MSSQSWLFKDILCCPKPDEPGFCQGLRLAQAGALLHNLGKITSGFLEWQIKGKLGKAPSFKYQHILRLIESDCSLLATESPQLYQALKEPENINVLDKKTIDLLKRHFKLPFPLNDRQYRPGDLLEYLGQDKIEGENRLYNKPGEHHFIKNIFPGGSLLTHLMNRAHRGASGGEKEDIFIEQQNTGLFRSTPFGWEIPAVDFTKVNDLKSKIEQAIQKHLSLDFFSFQNLQDLSSALRKHMVEALADTQRPLNDLTVWDTGHTAMAFLITQAMGLILQKRAIDHDELAKKEAHNSLYWRVLSLRLDGLAYLEGAATLADLRVRYRRLKETLKTAQDWLEERSIAIQVYQDENGAFLLFPDAGINHEPFFQNVCEKISPELNVDGITLLPELSPPLTSHPDDQGGKYAGTYIQEQLANSDLAGGYDLATYTAAWQSEPVYDICVACGIRPQGYGAQEIPEYQDNIGYYREKARKRKLCCICMDRRRDVAKLWLTKEENSTVWIDEVADNNGRIALVVGLFDLDDWQPVYPKAKEGSRSELLVDPGAILKIRNFGNEYCSGDRVKIRKYDFTWDSSLSCFVSVSTGIKSSNIPRFKNERLNIHGVITENGLKELSLPLTVRNINTTDSGYVLDIDPSVSECDGEIVKAYNQEFKVIEGGTKLLTNTEGAVKKVEDALLYDHRFMIEEVIEYKDALVSPSFGRTRRAWETTRLFWKEIESELGKIAGSDRRRIKIKGSYETREKSGKLTPYHAYELILGNTKTGVLWEDARFITIANLSYIASQLGYVPPARSRKEISCADQNRLQMWGAQAVRDTLLNGKSFNVAEPASYGMQSKFIGVFQVEEVEIAESSYLPAISILAEPRTFMVMVPADRALEVVKKIKEKHEREMGKVRNRLPLHLGIVFTRRRTPLRAVLEAGKRMLKRKHLKNESWKVTGAIIKNQSETPGWLRGDPHFTKWKKILLENERSGRVAVWRVPLVMGDGKTRDSWYPYAFLKADGGALNKLEFFRLEKRGSFPSDWIIYANSLQEQKGGSPGDYIYFAPSTFDFEFLDTSGRRFAIAYDEKGRRVESQRRQRPYLLDELEILEHIWNKLKKTLTKNQIYALCDLIETKRQEWQTNSEDHKMESETFFQFCRDALASARWQTDWKTNEHSPERANANSGTEQIKPNWLDKWAGYAANGWLADAVELYLQILKEEPET
ncbi:MAG: CRISPR-associated protein Csx11 [Peptococcaceae bacterium]|nr:MAG: CRISPR-associated protein Csx11 [Peptococcaceae bacterium]